MTHVPCKLKSRVMLWGQRPMVVSMSRKLGGNQACGRVLGTYLVLELNAGTVFPKSSNQKIKTVQVSWLILIHVRNSLCRGSHLGCVDTATLAVGSPLYFITVITGDWQLHGKSRGIGAQSRLISFAYVRFHILLIEVLNARRVRKLDADN